MPLKAAIQRIQRLTGFNGVLTDGAGGSAQTDVSNRVGPTEREEALLRFEWALTTVLFMGQQCEQDILTITAAYCSHVTWPLPGCGKRLRKRQTRLSSPEQGSAPQPARTAWPPP
eukprot:scaffold112985_cov58-Phaeocystis_antarctica.AAC.2